LQTIQQLRDIHTLHALKSTVIKKLLTRIVRLKSREMQLLASQECTWHCIHAQDAVQAYNTHTQSVHN